MSITHLHEAADGRSGFKQVRLSLWHPGCWTLEATDTHDGTHIIEKSLYPAHDVVKGDFILVSEGQTDLEEFVETVDGYDVVDDMTILRRSVGRARAVVNYRRESSIVPEVVNSAFMPIEPVHVTGGREYWTVMVEESALGQAVTRMERRHDVEVSSIQEVDPSESLEFADVVDSIYDDLSTRQRECLFQAAEAGYYTWPREVSAKDVAAETTVSGPTFLEHIRRGEQKIFRTVLAELRRRNKRY